MNQKPEKMSRYVQTWVLRARGATRARGCFAVRARGSGGLREALALPGSL